MDEHEAEGKDCDVGVGEGATQDFDCYHKITYMERLYDDILSQHHGRNKGQSLKQQCAEKFVNISKM